MKTKAGGTLEVPSSAHAVVSNDDLLIEILLRLPFLSLHLFKSVSKRWLTLITDPTFTLRLTQNPTLDPPSGLFLQQEHSFKYDFVPLDARIPSNRSPLPVDFDSHKVKILQSCNGLLLCLCYRSIMFYVYNPFTNRFKMIPRQSPFDLMFPIPLRMAFDPSKSPHYKMIIHAGEYSNHQIQIYSSETCNWSVYNGQFPFADFRGFSYGIYWNGAIHWVESLKRNLHFQLDVENPNLRSVQMPKTSDGATHCYRKLFESGGCLLLLCTEDVKLSIFAMRKWYSGWSLKYIVNLDDFTMQLIPKTWRRPPTVSFSNVIGCIMMEKNEEDSFIVMEIYGNIVQYKFVSKSVYKLYELKSVHSKVSFEFIASSADV